MSVRFKVFGVFKIKGRGTCVALADKAFAPGDHEALETGDVLRRPDDGAEWAIGGIERGVRRTGAYLLKGDAEPREGDILECDVAAPVPEDRGPRTYDNVHVYLNGEFLGEGK